MGTDKGSAQGLLPEGEKCRGPRVWWRSWPVIRYAEVIGSQEVIGSVCDPLSISSCNISSGDSLDGHSRDIELFQVLASVASFNK